MMKRVLLAAVLVLSLFTAFAGASENVPTEEEVAKLYVATFNRAPDSAGLDYWVNDSGLKLSEIAMSFFDQQETQRTYPPSTTTEAFITTVYRNLFNREPDAAGLAYWKNELDSGSFSRSLFIQTVINGAQGDDVVILENKKEVALAFADAEREDVFEAKRVIEGITSAHESAAYAIEKIESGDVGEGLWDGYTEFKIISPSIAAVDENQKSVLTIEATQNEGYRVYYTITGENGDDFRVNHVSGEVVFKQVPDFEKKSHYTFTAVAVRYKIGSSLENSPKERPEREALERAEQEVTVYVNNIPENPSIALFKKAIHMDQSPGSIVGQVKVLNSGDGNITSYSLEGTRDFMVVRNGIIINTTPFDFHEDTTLVFKIKVTNSAGQTGRQNALVTLVKDNTPPVAFDQNVIIRKNSMENLIELNATDAEGDELTFEIIDEPMHGTWSGIPPHVLYTPEDGYVGNDTFTFVANDGREDSNISTVTLNIVDMCWDSGIFKGEIVVVNDPYVTVDKWYFHHNGGSLSINLLSERGNGTDWIDINGDGIQSNLDTYIYLFNDNNGTAGSLISENDDAGISGPPIEDGTTHGWDSYLSFPNLSEGDYILSISDYDLSEFEARNDENNAEDIGVNPGAYQITFKGDVEIHSIPDNASAVCIVNTPPVAIDQNVSVDANSTDNPIELNATDADGDALAYTIVEEPLHGTLGGTAPNLTYTPEAGYIGEDSFTFLANDGRDDSNIATVSINVKNSCINLLIDDNFDNDPVGSLPEGWNIKYNGTGTANQKVVDTLYVSPNHSFQLEGRSGWAANIYKALPSIPDNITVEANINMEKIVGNWTGWFARTLLL